MREHQPCPPKKTIPENLPIVTKAKQPGASFTVVACRRAISHGLLRDWRKQVQHGELVQEPMPMFVPVQITPGSPLVGLANLRRIIAAVCR